jgi:NADPH:quinone reductase-like Zn-dependent oxidoreductase
MKAIVGETYGSPDALELREIAPPAIDAGDVLVRVRAASVNPADWHFLRGEPALLRLMSGLRRPKRPVPGMDVAGVVEQVGAGVTRFRPGDGVFGSCSGGFAELARGKEGDFAAKPVGIGFEQAAAVPIAGCTALEGLRDHGRLQRGQRVLVNGAAGGVGTFAVQLAKSFGGEVTAVCRTANIELVRSLGADHVVDYTAEDFARGDARYDLILNIAGNRSLADLRRVLTPSGTLVLIGAGVGRGGGGGIGPLARPVAAAVLTRFVAQRLVSFIAKVRAADLATLAELIETGKVTPVIDRVYPLDEVPDAIRYLETGHARGKVVITIVDG